MSDKLPSTISIPELCLVALVGASGSGKSTFAATHFADGEVLSSDFARLLVSDDAADQSATTDAFEVLHYIAAKRLKRGNLTVVDATNVQPNDRAPLVALARAQHVLPVAIVLDVPEAICRERNAERNDRNLPDYAVRRQTKQLQRSVKRLQREGFRRVYVLRGTEEIKSVTIERERLWTDQRHLHGPFDFIGDVHGCADELVALLGELGYDVTADRRNASHPDGRSAVFVGDLVDRGPDSPGVLCLAMGMVAAGGALCVPGNHENKLARALNGRKVTVSHGLAETLAQLEAEPASFREEVAEFIDGLVSHAVLDDGQCVVAHAGLPEALHGRSSGAVRGFALYGDTTGETDEFGLPVRYPWADDYRGDAMVVYGHTPIPKAVWVNNTICIDTGCVFGGELTALRYPEKELVSVPAAQTYYEPIRPLVTEAAVGDRPGGLLDASDVLGKRIVDTALQPRITIGADQAAAAFEVMGRFSVDPRWLVYLPPTMAPTNTSKLDRHLEHPAEAFASYRRDGIDTVVCEQKHMGSRAVAIVCRSAEAAGERFGVDSASAGVIVTRTGRSFFADPELEAAALDRLRDAIESADLWDELETDWMALDAELLPWNAKAEDLIKDQYAAVGAAARSMSAAAADLLAAAARRGVDVAALTERNDSRRSAAAGFTEAYGNYVRPVAGIDDLRLAPFVVLATEGAVRVHQHHDWHLAIADRLADASPGFVERTQRRLVDLHDGGATEAAATQWWSDLTEGGGEGMVVKPMQSIATGKRGLIQPGIKVRGREYLRIIYGPEYLEPANLDRLRKRSLGRKRSLAQREFALGVEALERFVARQPLHRVHECVFGVLALESDPVDPRL